MIHPDVQKLVDYPNTQGKRIAMNHYNWDRLTKDEEVMYAIEIIAMAKNIDKP